jgi:uncharacterized damage-inducible protein DinB
MDLLDHFRRMAENNLWANDRLYRALLVLQPGEFEASRTSFFPSIKQTLNHVLLVDIYYLDMLKEGGVGLRVFDRWRDFDDPARLAEAQAACDRDYLAFCAALQASDLGRRVSTDRGDDGQIPERIGDLLAHIFQHDIHHRGQVHAMLSGTSVKPPQLDEYFLAFDLKLRRDEVKRLGF